MTSQVAGGTYRPDVEPSRWLRYQPPPLQAVVGDGQVTRGGEVVKGNAVKVRRIGEGVISGFAGESLTCRLRCEACGFRSGVRHAKRISIVPHAAMLTHRRVIVASGPDDPREPVGTNQALHVTLILSSHANRPLYVPRMQARLLIALRCASGWNRSSRNTQVRWCAHPTPRHPCSTICVLIAR